MEIVLCLLHCPICWGIASQDGDLLPPQVEPGSDYPLRHRFSLQQALCRFFRQNEANSSLMIFTFIHSCVQHSFPCSYPQPPKRIPSHFTYSQNTNTIFLHHFNHLSTLPSLKQCPYIPLPNLHTYFWRQQFHRQFICHSLLCTLLQLGVSIWVLAPLPPDMTKW